MKWLFENKFPYNDNIYYYFSISENEENIKWFLDKISPHDEETYEKFKKDETLECIKSLLNHISDNEYVRKKKNEYKLFDEKT